MLSFRFNSASFEDLNDWVRNRWGSISKTRVKMVEIFGRIYWKVMDDKEYQKKINESIIKVDNVHSKDQLHKFVNDKLNNYHMDLFDGLPYRMFIVGNYTEGQSYILCLFSHAFMDGVTMSSIMQTCSDNFKPEHSFAHP